MRNVGCVENTKQTSEAAARVQATSLLLSSLLGGGSHQVESGTSLEEFDLTGVEGVVDLDLFLGAVLVGDLDIERLSRSELVKTEDGDLVSARNLVVVGGVLEPESQDLEKSEISVGFFLEQQQRSLGKRTCQSGRQNSWKRPRI